MAERWGAVTVWAAVTGALADVTDSLDLDADFVTLRWGRSADLADPAPSSLEFTLVNGDGAFTPLSSEGWKRGAAVELRVDGTTQWTGTVDTLTPGWGGSDLPAWSRVKVAALDQGAGWQQKQLGSMFDHEMRKVLSQPATNYWPLRGGLENAVNPEKPLALPAVTSTGTLEFGGDTAPAGDGDVAYLNRELSGTGDMYLVAPPVPMPGQVLIWGSYRPVDPAVDDFGLISFRAGKWIYTVDTSASGWLVLTNRDNDEALTSDRYGGGSITFKKDEPFLLLLDLNNGDTLLMRADNTYEAFSWPSGTYRPPPAAANVNILIGTNDTSSWGGRSMAEHTWKGTIGRVATYGPDSIMWVASVRELMHLAQKRGVPFRTALGNLYRYAGSAPSYITASTTHGNPYQTNERVWPDSAGKSAYQAILDLIIRTDGGMLGGRDPAVVWTRDALRKAAPEISFHAERDLDGPPELAFDQGASVGEVVVQTPAGEVAAVDSSAGTGAESFESAVLDAGQALRLGQDRIARVRELRLSLTKIVLDLAHTEASYQLGLLLEANKLASGSRIRVTGLPALQVGSESKDAYVLGGTLELSVSSCLLTLALAPADSPLEAIVEDNTAGLVDQCYVAF